MKYHYEKQTVKKMYGKKYKCDHPVYSEGTLYLIQSKGLVVIQQRYDKKSKKTWWSPIDDDLNSVIFFADGFFDYFNDKAGEERNGLYPTVTVRQIMWALRIRPLKKEPWETVFDHCPI